MNGSKLKWLGVFLGLILISSESLEGQCVGSCSPSSMNWSQSITTSLAGPSSIAQSNLRTARKPALLPKPEFARRAATKNIPARDQSKTMTKLQSTKSFELVQPTGRTQSFSNSNQYLPVLNSNTFLSVYPPSCASGNCPYR